MWPREDNYMSGEESESPLLANYKTFEEAIEKLMPVALRIADFLSKTYSDGFIAKNMELLMGILLALFVGDDANALSRTFLYATTLKMLKFLPTPEQEAGKDSTNYIM